MLSQLALAAALLAFVPRSAAAAGVGEPGEPLSLEVHGFVSPGFILSTDNRYLANSKRGSFEFSEAGINFTMPLADKLRLGMQLFSRKLGPIGNYTAKFDWFYLDYRFQDWLGLRAGRVKVPFGLYNDSSDIDSARVPILLPQSVYSLQNRDFLLAQTGAEVYGRVDMHALGALEYRMYAGTIFLDTASQSSLGTPVASIDVPYVVGERLLWETPLDGLRAGASVQALRLDASLTYKNMPLSIEVPAVLWLGSLEYAANDLLLSAEYSRWFVRLKTTGAEPLPESSTVSERAYAMASYRMASWLQPGVYYSLLFPDVHNRTGPAAVQHDAAATLRFDINEHFLFKLEGHYMNGTAGLSPSLNNGLPLNTLERSWGVFLAKATAYF